MIRCGVLIVPGETVGWDYLYDENTKILWAEKNGTRVNMGEFENKKQVDIRLVNAMEIVSNKIL
jgi:hypothetical protein